MGAGLAASVANPLFAMAKSTSPLSKNPKIPDLVGDMLEHTASKADTLLDLARTNRLGYVEMIAANPGIDPWLPGEGTTVILPTAHLLPSGPREGILLNLVDQRLYYFPPDGEPVESFPIGTGQEAWDTPTGATKIVRKKKNPAWYVPKSIRKEQPELPAVVAPGPDNPLGTRAMYLGWPSYLIHGTNNPWGVGRRVSHGCIRLYPENIEYLYSKIAIGTPVTVVAQEMKTGWNNGELLLEVHPNPKQTDEIEIDGNFTKAPVPELIYKIALAAGDDVSRVDWDLVKQTARRRSGMPVSILRKAIAENEKTTSKS
jgi:L,D-transpeptidase ErfK/SrfK